MNIDTQRIRLLNDEARRHLVNGTSFLSRGVAALPSADQAAIVDRVRTFEDFAESNDPHGEHDFGTFEHNGQTIFWKIDCYDRDLRYGSPDPADPAVTRRVLTVMLAEEY
jgi:hypothetical protein